MTIHDFPIVRVALPKEEDEILEMCKSLHGENGLFSFSEDKVRDCIRRCYRREGGIVGVIGETGKLQASIGILISDSYYSHQWHLAELWTHVLPDHRKSHNAQALIEFGKRCAIQIGVPLITGIITNRRLSEKIRLYRKQLGIPSGVFFVFNANWANETEPDAESFYPAFESRAEKRQRMKRMNGAE